MAVGNGPANIRINSLAGWMVWKEFVEDCLDEEVREGRRRAGALHSEGTAWDVGWAAGYLASDEVK